MYDYYIYSQLRANVRKNKSFHMPGHKARGEFAVRFPVADMDVTELEWSDNLQNPSGAIARAQRDLAEFTGADGSFITTDGSSSGIFAMLSVAAKRGGKVAVGRNSHQSVWNACAALGIEPLALRSEEREGMLMPPDLQEVERLLVNDRGISAVLLTSPDYYGNILPLEKYAELTRRHGRLLIVDGAHGAHLALGEGREGYAGVYADMWVDGAHKSLPALTQGALVNAKGEELCGLLAEALLSFRTTSPSYPIMASVEYGYKYIANNPDKAEAAMRTVADFKTDNAAIPFYKPEQYFSAGDWTKLVLDCEKLDIASDLVCAELKKSNIYPELDDGRYILFYLSPATAGADLKGLSKCLKQIVKGGFTGTYAPRPALPAIGRAYSYLYALKQRWEYVPLREAEGRMCAANIGVTPPCIPVAVAGDIITGEIAAFLLGCGKTLFGLKDGCVRVVKK